MAVYSKNALLGTAVALPFLGVIAVCLRFYVRLRMRRTYLGADDWLVLLAVILVCGHGVIQVLGVELGVLGQDDTPSRSLDTYRVETYNKIVHAIVIIEKVTYSAIKLSVLYLYRRVFGTSKKFRTVSDVLAVSVVLWGLVFLFVEAFICTTDGKQQISCGPQEWTLLWFAITEVLGDIVILALPYPFLRRLQMSKREKIGITAIFALGTISTIFGIIRLAVVVRNFHFYFHPEIFNDQRSAPPFWTTAEVSIGVLAACLPPLGPLLRMIPAPRRVYASMRPGGSSSRSRSRPSMYAAQGSDRPGPFVKIQPSLAISPEWSSSHRFNGFAKENASPDTDTETWSPYQDIRTANVALDPALNNGFPLDPLAIRGETWLRHPLPDKV